VPATVPQVLCTICHPFSLHLYERLGDALTMTSEYCEKFYSACSPASQLDLPANYCEIAVGGAAKDQFWSYPLVIEGEE